MQLLPTAGVVGALAVIGTFALVPRLHSPDPKGPGFPPPQGPTGHLILLIEGDARGLSVTHIAAKNDAYNPVRGINTPYEVVVYDANHKVLGRYPLDLSQFDLSPLSVGKPQRVEGCEVIDTTVAMLTNIPWFRAASFLQIEKGGVSVGDLLPGAYARLLDQTNQGKQR